jgi:hypothetical protein
VQDQVQKLLLGSCQLQGKLPSAQQAT